MPKESKEKREEEKNCSTCKYDNWGQECPSIVDSCEFYSEWEPKESEEKINKAENLKWVNPLEHDLTLLFNNFIEFLLTKNNKYGNSALEPIKVFSKSTAPEQILNRIDDKLSRIKNSEELRKNDIVDLTGYLVLLMIKNNWTDFKEMID